jgi:aspartyl protease family protein
MPDNHGPWGSRDPQPPPRVDRRWPPRWWPLNPRRKRLLFGLLAAGGVGLGLWALWGLFPDRIDPGYDWGTIGFRLGLIVLVAASLFSRGLKLGQAFRYLAIWVAIAGVLALGFAFRGELGDGLVRLRSALIPGYAVPSGDHQMVLTEGADGGFGVFGQVNGQPVRFVVDTGASDIVLSPQDARRVGVDLDRLDFSSVSETANGLGHGAPFVADSLSVGPIRLTNVKVSINRAPMSASLLGMAFLRRLKSFEVSDGRLILRWRG